jgi:hypothetical protein
MNYKKFEDLPCWKKARDLCKSVFNLINKRKFHNDYSLKDQIWRAAGYTIGNDVCVGEDLIIIDELDDRGHLQDQYRVTLIHQT